MLSKIIFNSRVLYLFLFLVFLSCKKEVDTISNTEISTIDTAKIKNKKDIRSIGQTLSPQAKKEVENWLEYQQLDQLLTNFYTISPNEALDLSQELSKTTQQLKDSLTIDRFKEPDMAIRINVLHNNALRLADMATIQSIGTEEIRLETQQILDAFSALNSKINNIINQKKLEAELKDF